MPRTRIVTLALVVFGGLVPHAPALARPARPSQDTGSDAGSLWNSVVPVRPTPKTAHEMLIQGFEDLEPLVEWVGDARVVLLGEPTHGDGRTFLDKTRVIAFLHRRLGFDVVCFESGFVSGELSAREWERQLEELRAADEAARLTAAREGLEAFVFPIWTQSREFEPLVELLALEAGTERPLLLAGYDCQVTGPLAQSVLAELDLLLADAPPDPGRTRARARLLELIEGADPEPWMERTPGPGEQLRPALLEALERHAVEPAERAFLLQALRSLDGQARHRWASSRDGASLADTFDPRDAQGGENLRWLLEQRHPGRRVVVWLASMHALRSHEGLDPGPGLDYAGVLSAGSYLAGLEGDPLRVLAFTAHGGRAGLPWGNPWTVSQAPEGSLEDLLERAGHERAFVPVRGPGRADWWDAPRSARPLGYRPMRARWSDHVDGFWFTCVQAPSHRRADPQELAELEDLLAHLGRRAERAQQALEGGNPFAHKGDWSMAWVRWCELFDPDADVRVAQRARVLEWLDGLEPCPAWTWRVASLRALLLEEAGEAEEALAAGERALAAYPHHDFARPSVHSSLQHLLNAEVQRTWRLRGAEAALEQLETFVATDPRLAWFHAPAWGPAEVDLGGGRGPTAQEAERLVQALARACARRAEAGLDSGWCAEVLGHLEPALAGD